MSMAKKNKNAGRKSFVKNSSDFHEDAEARRRAGVESEFHPPEFVPGAFGRVPPPSPSVEESERAAE